MPVAPGTANLSFSVQPTTTVAGQVITPHVSVLATDAAAQPVSNVPVTIALNGTGTLAGTLSRVTGANGLAVFDDLSVNAAGTGNTLSATAQGFLSATSTPFDVASAAAPGLRQGGSMVNLT